MLTNRRTRSAAVVGLALAVLLAASGCSGRRSEQYRQEGDTYLRLNKLDDAATAYSRAEQANPSNAWAKIGLGHVHLAREEYAEALTKFEEAAALTPAVGAELETALEAFLRAERVNEALTLVERFEAADPLNGGLLHVYLLRESGQTQEALRVLADLTRDYPDRADVWITSARTHLAAGQPDQAERDIRETFGMPDVDAVAASMVLVDVYAAQGRLNEAVALFRTAADDDPSDISAKLALARILAETGEMNEAQELARDILTAQPNAPWANYVLGSVALAEQRPVDAVALLQEAARRLPRERLVLRRLNAAERAIRGAPGDLTADVPARPLPTPEFAEEQFADWQTLWRQAALRRLLENRAQYLNEDPSVELREALLLAAVFTQQQSIAAELTAALPQTSPLKGYIDLLERPSLEAVRAFFEAWAPEGPDDVIRANALGYALATVGTRAQAVYVLSQAYEQAPQHNVCLYNLAQIYRAAQMPDFAARVLEGVVSNALDNAEAHTLLFVVLRQAGMNDKARSAAESAYSLFPRDTQMVLNLAQAYLDAGEAGLAERALQQGRRIRPDDPALRATLAAVFLQQDRPDEARALLVDFEGPETLALETRALTAFAHALEGAWDDTANLLEDKAWRDLQPATQYLAATALLRLDREQEGLEVLRAAQAPRGLLDMFENASTQETAQSVFAAALQQRRLHRQAFELYQRLLEEGAPTPWLLENAFFSLQHAPSIADRLTIAQTLATRHPESAEAWIGLAAVANATGDAAAEEDALAQAVQTAPESVLAWQRRAEYFERNNRLTEALESYERLITLAPDSGATNNNLAYCLLMTGGDQNAAMNHAERAHELLPTNANVLHTLGLAQMRTGNLEQSRRNLAVALELMPANPTLLLDFGLLAMRMGEEEAGLRYVELALRYASQLNLDFPRREEALGVLAEATGSQEPV